MDIKISLSKLTTFYGNKKIRHKVPFKDKPIVFNNLIFMDPQQIKTESGYNFNPLFNLFRTNSQTTTYTSNKTYEPKVETKVTTKVETAVATKVETAVKTATKTQVKTATKSNILKSSKVKTKSLSLKTAVLKTSEVALKTATAAVKTIAFPLTMSFKGVKMLFEKISDLRVEHKYNKIYENQQLQELQKEFERDLKQYKNLFEMEDMKPNFVKYNIFKGLSYKNLSSLHSLLLYDISRQSNLINVKRAIREGADGYNGNRGGCSDAVYALKEIRLPRSEYYNCKEYKQELKRLCKIYIDNSKSIERPLKNFKDIINNFFAKNSEKLQEIYDIQNDKAIKLLERIPKIGIIPKGLRVYEQWNLANCITKDFRAVTDKHVYYGMHQAALKYDEQYKTITKFAERHRMAFDKNNTLFTDKMLEIIEKAHSDRAKVYSKLYDRFITGGCNMKKICKKTKLRGGANLAKKTILTLMPFVC